MKLNNKVYDVLKWVAMVGLPALAALYYGLASIWGWPNTEQVTGSITIVNTFIGALIGISSIQYNKK